MENTLPENIEMSFGGEKISTENKSNYQESDTIHFNTENIEKCEKRGRRVISLKDHAKKL
jgi:hypothetical protein